MARRTVVAWGRGGMVGDLDREAGGESKTSEAMLRTRFYFV